MLKLFFTLLCLALMQSCISQTPNPLTDANASLMPDSTSALPYDTLPSYPEAYTATTVLARMIDGLGFRYRWATEDLRPEDLEYRFSESTRTSMETMYHIHGLSMVIVNSTSQSPNVRPQPENDMEWTALRKETLSNFQAAAQNLMNSTPADLDNFNIIFQRGDKESSFPIWHLLNGPIADALWHVGQIVAMRRVSGNPFDSRVNVFMGNLRER